MNCTETSVSDTPRTDAAVYSDMEAEPIKDWVPAEVSRQIERELAAANAIIRMMREARDEHLSRCQGENRL